MDLSQFFNNVDSSGVVSGTPAPIIDMSGDIGSSANVFPPVPSGTSPSDALGIFQSIGDSLMSAATTIQNFRTQAAVNSANAQIQTTAAQTQAQLAAINAQTALARARAALANPNDSLMILLVIIGLGLAWMQYSK